MTPDVYMIPHIIIVNQRPSINKETSKYRCEKQKWAGRNAAVRPGDNAGITDDFIAKRAASGKPKPPFYDISSITQPLSP